MLWKLQKKFLKSDSGMQMTMGNIISRFMIVYTKYMCLYFAKVILVCKKTYVCK